MNTPDFETQPTFENQVDPGEELASAAASVSSYRDAALVFAALLGYAGYIWLAARRGRQDDIELVALAWLPLIATILRYGASALKVARSILSIGFGYRPGAGWWFDLHLGNSSQQRTDRRRKRKS